MGEGRIAEVREQKSDDLAEWKKQFFEGRPINDQLFEKISDRLDVVKINGTWVVFFQDEIEVKKEARIVKAQQNRELVKPLIDNPNTVGVMIEYFAPELKKNARESFVVAKPFIRQALDNPEYRSRVFGYDYLARLAKAYHKDVYVADIANKPAYQALRMAYGYVPGLATGAVLTQSDSFPGKAAGALAGSYASAVAQELISRMTTHKNKLEDIVPTPEDARRVFIARGIQEITERINKQETKEGKTLLVVYPEAHKNRILSYLRSFSLLKSKIYKVSMPGLDFNVRRYCHTQVPGQEKNDLSGWKLLEKIPI